MTSAPSQSRRWLLWLLFLPLHPVVGILGMVVATGCLDHTLLPWYSAMLGLALFGGAAVKLQRWLTLPIPPLHCLLGVGGVLTGLLFWLNLTYSGTPVVRSVPIQEKSLQRYYQALVREGEVSVTVQVGFKELEIDLTRADTALVQRATVCDVGVAPGGLGIDVVTQYRLRSQ